MKKNISVISLILLLLLVFCFLPATALAEKPQESPAPTEKITTNPEPSPEEKPAVDNENIDAPKESSAVDASKAAVSAESVTNPEDSTLYSSADSRVYNNGGIVYNNGGVIYNNGGTVYNNEGTVYNNGGTVYNNGGSVYNNGGTVCNNLGTVYNNGGEMIGNENPASRSETADTSEHIEADEISAAFDSVKPEKTPAAEESAKPEKTPAAEDSVKPEETPAAEETIKPEKPTAPDGYFRVEPTANVMPYVRFDGLEELDSYEGLWIKEGESCSIYPVDGFTIINAEALGGICGIDSYGVIRLTRVKDDVELRLEVKANAPEFSLAEGSYIDKQILEISAVKGAEIYYTLDGSEPTAESERYTEPIEIETSTVVKAIAIAENAAHSRTTEASYCFLKVKSPEFKALKLGYRLPEPKPIVVKNESDIAGRIKNIILTGEDASCFTLSSTAGYKIPAQSTEDQFWTIRPNAGLEEGKYTAIIRVILDADSVTEFPVSVTVKR